jgi:penicillin-binding protein 1A
VAAQLGQQVTFDAVAAMARRFGITTPISTNPSMVLGSNDVRVIDMVRAFAAVSAKGTSVEPYGITKVLASDGRVLYEHPQAQGQTLVAPFVAAGMTDLMQTAVNIGTGRARRSAARWQARPAPPPATRMAGSWAFPAGSPPACGWAATMRNPCPACKAAPRPRAPSRNI